MTDRQAVVTKSDQLQNDSRSDKKGAESMIQMEANDGWNEQMLATRPSIVAYIVYHRLSYTQEADCGGCETSGRAARTVRSIRVS